MYHTIVKSALLPSLLTILLAGVLLLPFLSPGLPATHDGIAVGIRLADMVRTLKEGQFPVRYSGYLNFTYGYPLFNFAYPAPYYLGAVLRLLPMTLVDTVKLLYLGSTLLAGIFMFLAARKLWGSPWAGLAAGVLYLYLPYRIVNLYVRGSIGETVGGAVYPLLLWLWLKLIERPGKLWAAAVAAAFAFLITTHNIASLLFTPVLAMLLLICILTRRSRAAAFFAGGLVLGLVLSAFFWLPALAEKKYILLSQVPIAHREYYFLKLADLWTPKWGYGIPDSPAGFGYQLGWPHLLVLGLAALSMIFALVRKAKRPPADYFRLVFTASSLLLLVFLSFFLFSPSSSIWQALPLFKEINYPWTLLGPMGFVTALLSGFLFRNKYTAFLALALAAAAVIFVLPHARPRDYLLYPDEFYVTNDATTTSSNELMPLWVKQFPSGRPGTTMEITQGEGQIKTVSANSRQIKAVAETTSPAALRLNRIYYPGWDITLDGAPRRYTYDNDYGAMEFSVPPGRYEIKAVFSETPLRQFANLLSLGGLIFCAFFLFLFSPRRARLPRPSKTCPMECDRKT